MKIAKLFSAVAVSIWISFSAHAQGPTSFTAINVGQTLTTPGGTTLTASGGILTFSGYQAIDFAGGISVLGHTNITTYLDWVGGGNIADSNGSPTWEMTGTLTLQTPEISLAPYTGATNPVYIENTTNGGQLIVETNPSYNGALALSGGAAATLTARSGDATITGSGNAIIYAQGGLVYLDGSLGTKIAGITTLGDTMAVGSSTALARVAGNTSSRRAYYSQTGTGSASAAPVWTNWPTYNVADYGITPDSSTDWSGAINSIVSGAPAGCVIYFPPSGTSNYYRVDGLASTTTDIALVGDADNTTLIETQSTTSPIFQSTAGNVSITNLQFQSVNSRAYGYPLMSIAGASRSITISNIQSRCTGDAWVFGNATGFLEMTNCNLKTISPAGCVVQFASGDFTNCDLNCTGNGRPAMLQVGTSSGGTQIANCEIQGGGPQYSYSSSTVSSIGSNGSFITVDMSNTTGINPGTWVVLSGMTTTAYNGFYRATTVAANTYLGLTPIGPPFSAIPSSGTCTIGTGVVETVPGCFVVAGDMSQAQISNIIFEGPSAGYPSDPISAAVFIDGTQNSSGVSNGDVAEQFTGCYYDWGKLGALILGGGTNGSTINTGRIEFTGGQVLSNNTYTGLGGVWISKAPGVKVNGLQSTALNIGTANSTWIYIYSDSNIVSDGCEIQNCAMGSTIWNGVSYSTYVPQYAITVDGSAGSVALNSLGFSNNMAWGQTAVTNILNGGVTSSTVIYGGGNGYFTGTSNPPTHAANPTYFP